MSVLFSMFDNRNLFGGQETVSFILWEEQLILSVPMKIMGFRCFSRTDSKSKDKSQGDGLKITVTEIFCSPLHHQTILISLPMHIRQPSSNRWN